MASDVATLDSMWQAVAGEPITDTVLEWPPDVFALTDVALEQTEAYRFVLSPPPGRHWPPSHLSDWSGAVRAAAEAWTVWARDRNGAPPSPVADAWATVRDAAEAPLEDIAEGRRWPVCEALLTLHTIADEACAGMGVAVGGRGRAGAATRGRGRELLAGTGSLARVGRPSLRVLPKVRTPAGGISLRSLSRYACVRGASVDAVWHKVPAQRPGHDPRRQPASILLLPWPLRIRESDFRPLEASIQRERTRAVRSLRVRPRRGARPRVARSSAGGRARRGRHRRHGGAARERRCPTIGSTNSRRSSPGTGVGVVVAGVRETAAADGRPPGNWVHIGVLLGGRWWHYRQNKHHRWSLEESQVLQYHLGGALHPSLRWWETMEVPRRAVQFLEIGGGITIVAVVCEDLARLDAVADLLRTVGPTLVLTVLLDGPQLASRWTARYASVLADDPGSAVLDPHRVRHGRALGPRRLRPVARGCAVEGPDRVGFGRSRSIPVPMRCCCRRRSTPPPATRPTGAGRRTTRRACATPVCTRCAPPTARRPTAPAPPPDQAGAADLDERALTVLASWAEALAEAGTEAEAEAVVADAAAGATWREELGLGQPAGGLGKALVALVRLRSTTDEQAPVRDDPYARLARTPAAVGSRGAPARPRRRVTPGTVVPWRT